jgi:glycosyltransferase involved in cell wall biosynthesis
MAAYHFELFESIASRWDREFHVLHDPLPATGQFAHESFKTQRFRSMSWRGASARNVLQFIKSARPEVVLLYGSTAQREAAIAATVLSRCVPFVYASDINLLELPSARNFWRKLLAYRILFSRVDAALALGLTNETALRLLGARCVLPVPCYAADYARLKEAGAERADDWPPADGRPTALFVGRLVPEKNLDAVIDAMAADRALRSGLRLVVAGDGPERVPWEAHAKSAGLDARFVGAIPRPNIGRYLARADVLVLPSTVEPWGIVVTEALGLGVPVVASPRVGAAISLSGTTQAVVVTAGNTAEDFRIGLRAFLERQDTLRTAAHSAASSVREQYDRGRVAEALVREVTMLYDSMKRRVAPERYSR